MSDGDRPVDEAHAVTQPDRPHGRWEEAAETLGGDTSSAAIDTAASQYIVPDDLRSVVEDHPEGLDGILRAHHEKRENADLRASVVEWLSQQSQGRDRLHLLRYLVLQHNHGAVTYDDLSRIVSVSDRSMRGYVSELADIGVVVKSEGNPLTISFADDSAYVIAEDLTRDI